MYTAAMKATEVVADVSPKNKTLYVRAEDSAVWSRAEELAGRQSISALVTDLLRQWVEQEEHGLRRVEVEVDDDYGRGSHKKAFQGRLLSTVPVPNRPGVEWTVYVTAKDQLALYGDRMLSVYTDVTELQRNLPQPEIVARIKEALTREYVEELDI